MNVSVSSTLATDKSSCMAVGFIQKGFIKVSLQGEDNNCCVCMYNVQCLVSWQIIDPVSRTLILKWRFWRKVNWSYLPEEKTQRLADESEWVTQIVCVCVSVCVLLNAPGFCVVRLQCCSTWEGFICVLQVLCSNSVLDSSEYWLRNEKALCRLGLLDDDTEGSCTMVSSILRAMKHVHANGNKAVPSHLWL